MIVCSILLMAGDLNIYIYFTSSGMILFKLLLPPYLLQAQL